jgi:hypothetical protein
MTASTGITVTPSPATVTFSAPAPTIEEPMQLGIALLADFATVNPT